MSSTSAIVSPRLKKQLPREVLESLRAQLGAETFAAQYQQQPVAPGGAMIKHAWVRRYDQLPKSGRIIQSWDVAHKQGEKTIVAISGNGSISF
jgi:hypothetical protein